MRVYDDHDDGNLRYSIEKVEDRVFTGQNYYLPIPLKEQERNPLLKD